jgi:pimeloyl-ACP methyl ester carboxylesterase
MTLALGTMRWGDGPRRILLLHGISSNAAGWWRLGPDLADAGWTVAAPDLRGHGTSPISDDYTIAAYAGDVLALGGGWDAVLGHSLGAAVAVAAHAADADWCRGLVLEEPALLISEDRFDEALAVLLDAAEGPAGERELARVNPSWHPTDARIKAEALQQTSPAVVRGTMEQNRPWNLLEAAAGVTVPTVILGADPDCGGITPVSVGEWLAGSNPAVRYRLLEGTGHSIHREVDGYGRFLEILVEALEWIGGED